MAHGVLEGLPAEGVTDDGDRGYRDNFFSVKVITYFNDTLQ